MLAVKGTKDAIRRRVRRRQRLIAAGVNDCAIARQTGIPRCTVRDWRTEEFIRGLIDSDGCRVVANDRGVASIRYHFSNRSDDIRGLFCAALDQLGIPWTRPSKYQVAVYRKAATVRLDEFVGPKA
jgi:hypothetical protein